MGFFGSLFGVTKMNADPVQQQFAQLLKQAAEDPSKHGQLIKQGWPGSETRTRVAHALSIVKISSIPDTYSRAKEIAYDISMASYRLG